MEIKANRLNVGHIIPDGSWGQYRVVKVTVNEETGYVTAETRQGSVKRTFLFHGESTIWIV